MVIRPCSQLHLLLCISHYELSILSKAIVSSGNALFLFSFNINFAASLSRQNCRIAQQRGSFVLQFT